MAHRTPTRSSRQHPRCMHLLRSTPISPCSYRSSASTPLPTSMIPASPLGWGYSRVRGAAHISARCQDASRRTLRTHFGPDRRHTLSNRRTPAKAQGGSSHMVTARKTWVGGVTRKKQYCRAIKQVSMLDFEPDNSTRCATCTGCRTISTHRRWGLGVGEGV